MICLSRVAEEIKSRGFRIDAGPFENTKYSVLHGRRMVRIKTVLTPAQAKELGLVITKPDTLGKPRSVRFVVTETDTGVELTHVTSSMRKRRKPRRKRGPE